MRLFDAVRIENQLVNISRNNSRTAPKREDPLKRSSLVVNQAQLYMKAIATLRNTPADYEPSIDELIDEEIQNQRPVKLVNYSGNKNE